MDDECVCDALLPDVLAQGQEERQKFRSLAANPEENWLDGFIAGWFAGHFKASSESTQEEYRNGQQNTEIVFQ